MPGMWRKAFNRQVFYVGLNGDSNNIRMRVNDIIIFDLLHLIVENI